MKVIKNILFLIIGLLVLLALFGFFLPSEQVFGKSINIKEPIDQLEDRLNRDTEIASMLSRIFEEEIQTHEQEVSRGPKGGVLMYQNSDSNSDENLILVDINLYNPFEQQTSTAIELENTREGTILSYRSSYGLSWWKRVPALLLNLPGQWEEKLQTFFDTLKENAESDFLALIDGYYIEERDEIERNFVIKRRRIPFNRMNEFAVTEFPKLDNFLQQRGMRDYPMTHLYYFIDHENRETDLAVAAEIDRDIEVPEEFEMKYFPRGRVIYTRHNGYVGEVDKAHNAVRKYLDQNNLQHNPPFLETYEIGADVTDDTSEWITLVEYYIAEDLF